MHTSPHKDQKYIEALLNNNSLLIEEIYQKWGPDVRKFVLKNNGSLEEANDLFQESLETLLDKAKTEKFVLTAPLGSFLYYVYRNKWYNKLKIKKRKEVIIEDLTRYINETESKQIADELTLFEKRLEVFSACFKKLSEKCQNVLNGRYENGMNSEEMMQFFKLPSISAVNKGMFDCRKTLKKYIMEHPQFKVLYLD